MRAVHFVSRPPRGARPLAQCHTSLARGRTAGGWWCRGGHHCCTWPLPRTRRNLLKAHPLGRKKERAGEGKPHTRSHRIRALQQQIAVTFALGQMEKINKGQEGTINRPCRKIITPRSLQHLNNKYNQRRRQLFCHFIHHRSYRWPAHGGPEVPLQSHLVSPDSTTARTRVPESRSERTGYRTGPCFLQLLRAILDISCGINGSHGTFRGSTRIPQQAIRIPGSKSTSETTQSSPYSIRTTLRIIRIKKSRWRVARA